MQKIYLIFVLFFSSLMLSAQNVRLAKSIYKGNDLSEVMEYFYSKDGNVKKITQTQDGKLHSTISDLIFNGNGLLASYTETFDLKISPQKTTITYDGEKRISTFKTIKTQDEKVMKTRSYSYDGDIVTVIEPVNNSYKTIYYFSKDGDITKMQDVWDPSTASTRLYDEYDLYKNPLTMTGGFITDKPISKHNSLADNYVDIYLIKRKLEYSKQLIHKHVPGGAKIPTMYGNNLLIKATETSFSKDLNKLIPVSTTTYEYIILK